MSHPFPFADPSAIPEEVWAAAFEQLSQRIRPAFRRPEPPHYALNGGHGVFSSLTSEWGRSSTQKKSEGTPLAPEAIDPISCQMPSDLPVMVPLSVAEIRRLFFRLVSKPPLSFAYHLAWSFWRRAPQALARLYHYKRWRALASHLQL